MMFDNIEVCGDKWRCLNFILLLDEMSNSISLMIESKKRSLECKKQLAEHTKLFQRQHQQQLTDDCEISLNELLKEYQLEIDTLSRRAKQAETSFNKLYELLKPLPDPVTFLPSSINNIIKLKDNEINLLTSKLNDLEIEFSTLTNQAVTVRKLREALNDKDNDINNKINEALIKQEKDFIIQIDNNKLEYEREREILYNELNNERQNVKLLNECIKRKDEEHIRNNKISDDNIQALITDNDTLSLDIERLTTEMEQLQNEIKVNSNETSHGGDDYIRLNNELKYERERCEALEITLDKERNELKRVNKEHYNVINNIKERENKLKIEINIKENEINMANEKIKRLQEVEDELEKCKSKINIMEIVEYNADPSKGETELEIMLLEKVKALQSQLAPLRAKICEYDNIEIRLKDKEDEIRILKEALDNIEKQQQQQQQQQHDSGHDIHMNIPYTKYDNNNERTPSLLDITKQQRDYLKGRVLALEEERDTLRNDILDKCRKCDKLHNDNIKLLEQKKYWQSISSSSGNSCNNVKHRQVNIDDVEDNNDVEMRYISSYNEDVLLSPFDTFKNSERQKRLMSLPRGERIIVQVLTIMVGNRIIRIITAIYLIALHMLVFIVLYKLMRISISYETR